MEARVPCEPLIGGITNEGNSRIWKADPKAGTINGKKSGGNVTKKRRDYHRENVISSPS